MIVLQKCHGILLKVLQSSLFRQAREWNLSSRSFVETLPWIPNPLWDPETPGPVGPVIYVGFLIR